MSWDEPELHFAEGFIRVRKQWQAGCHCGWFTTPRASREQAREALAAEHCGPGARADTFRCGCSHAMVAVFGHYHDGVTARR